MRRRAQGDLFGRFLAGDIDDRSALGRRGRSDLEQQGRLAHPGFAGDQNQRSRDETAAENPVDAVETGGGAGRWPERRPR